MKLKSICILLFSILFLTVSNAQTLNFEFYSSDNSGKVSFDLKSFSKLSKEDNIPLFYTLIESPDSDSLFVALQTKEIYELVREQFSIIIIYSNTLKENTSYYHTSIDTAKKLAKGLDDFRITLIDSDTNIIKQSTKPIKVREIIELLEKIK